MIRAIVAAGDHAALEELSSRIARCVNFVLNQYGWFKIATLAMREEIAQESLVRLVDRVQRGFDGEDAQFKTYVYKVVYSVTSSEVQNACKTSSLDEEVSRADGSSVPLKNLIAAEISPLLGLATDPPDPVEGMARAEKVRRVAEALAMLSPGDREALRLFDMEGLSTRAVAERMKLTEGTVSVRLHRARERMARAYLLTYTRKPFPVDETWILSLIERLPEDQAAVMQSWWEARGSAKQIAMQQGIPENKCRDLLDRGKATLSRLAEETPRASRFLLPHAAAGSAAVRFGRGSGADAPGNV